MKPLNPPTKPELTQPAKPRPGLNHERFSINYCYMSLILISLNYITDVEQRHIPLKTLALFETVDHICNPKKYETENIVNIHKKLKKKKK